MRLFLPIRLRRAVVVLGLMIACGPSVLASSDQDRARSAVEAGQVLPLRTLLERVEREQSGRVLEVELEQEGGRWVYEFRLLRPNGRLAKIKVDARSGELLSRQERH